MHKPTDFAGYSPPIDLSNRLPDDLSPVSPDKDGKVLSYFGDSIWDFSYLKSRYTGYNIIDFREENICLNSETIYHFKLALYYELFYSRKTKDILSSGTIIGKYLKIKKISTLFKSNNSSFINLRKNGISQKELLKQLSLSKEITIGQYYNCLNLINATGSFFRIEGFGFDQSFMDKVKNVMGQSIKTRKQTLLIPSRIYSNLIESGLDVFNKFNNYSPLIESYFLSGNYSSLNPNTGRVKVRFAKHAHECGIIDFINDFEITTSQSLVVRLSQIQTMGFLLIACFSGMRSSEIKSLGPDCLNICKIADNEIYTLTGYTSKTTNIGLKKTSWITSELIKPVIQALKVLRKICKSISDQRGLYTNIKLEELPLFPHFMHHKLTELTGSHPLYPYPPTLLDCLESTTAKLIKNVDIRESDIDELTQFNSLIDWGEEYKLVVGKNWKFKSHQFRRSLVVYGVRSGIIKLSVLKKQLQHLTLNMTIYYGNQASTARNLFDEYIISEFRKEDIRYQFVQYEEKVIDTKDTLFGGEGTRLQLSKRSPNVPEYLVDKTKTYRYFEEGRIAYKKTFIGGCSKVGSCDKLGFSYITVCLNCKDAIFDSSTKEALIKTKRAYLQRLEKYEFGSIIYKQLQIEINAINKMLNKVEMIEIGVSDV